LAAKKRRKTKAKSRRKTKSGSDLKANLKENHSVVMQLALQDEQKQWNKFSVQNLSLQVK